MEDILRKSNQRPDRPNKGHSRRPQFKAGDLIPSSRTKNLKRKYQEMASKPDEKWRQMNNPRIGGNLHQNIK